MIVLDASVVVDLLLNLPPYPRLIAQRITEASPALFAPYLLDAEVAQVLCRYTLRGQISPERASLALQDLRDLPIHRYPHLPLLERAFELRDNATIYDALYLVLAESIGATLLTRDAALASLPGVDAEVEVVGESV